MRIEQITINNFRVFKEETISNIPGFAVFVGANGSGKTTLFDVFGFLKDCLKNNVRQALQKRGGFKEVISRQADDQTIVIEIKFRLMINQANRLVTYRLEIGLKDDRPIVEWEVLRYKRGSYGSPYHFIDFQNGKGYAVTNEEDFDKTDEKLEREYQTLKSPDILAVKGVGQFERFKAASAFRQLIEEWHVSDIYIDSARGKKDAGYAEHLSSRGDNIPLVAQYIYENHPDIFEIILKKMSERVPGIEKVEAYPLEDGSLVLRYHDGSFKDPFVDRSVSDGTIKMFTYLLLLYDPDPHPLLCVEEPENQLYPDLLEELAEEFRSYSEQGEMGGQVLVSTHSPDFLNAINLDELFWLVKGEDGYTTVRRARDDELIKSLIEEGDKLGLLWKQGFLKGAGPR